MAATQKVALVTGAGTGIGKAVALALMRQGYAVTLAGRRQDKLDETAQEGIAIGATSLVVPTDVSDPASVKAVFAKTKEAFGRLDVLFNNAGIFAPKPFIEVTEAEYDRFLDNILKGSFFSAALMSELFVGMLAVSALAGLSWSSHVAKIAKGLTVYSAATLVLETANTWLGLGGSGRIYDDFSRVRIAIYLGCVAYWIVALWRDAPPARRMPDHVRRQASAISQAVKMRVESLREAGEP